MLYIISTPIGNLEDITLRALRILKEVDLIAAEDTRHTKIILNKYEIKTPTISYHSHSGTTKIEKIIDHLKKGSSVAIVSDAGTPGISDPAYSLVTRAIEEGIKLSPIPGPSALLAALVVSGLPMNQFLYLGFLPTKKGRKTLFESLNKEERTVVFFESPHRLNKTFVQMVEYLDPNRKIVIARELTKIYEEVFRGTISEAKNHFTEKKPKGEFVIILGGQNL